MKDFFYEKMNRQLPPIVKNLLIINVLMYLGTWMLPTIFRRVGVSVDLVDLLGMHYFASEKFNLLQLVTYMFMHAPFPNFSHIFFNMFALFIFGPILEQVWGAKKFLLYYFITGIGAGLIQQFFWYLDVGDVLRGMNHALESGNSDALSVVSAELSRYFRISGDVATLSIHDVLVMKKELENALITVGASGAIYGILLAFGWLFPDERMFLLFLPVPIKARYFVIGYAVLELFLGVSNFSGDSVAHFAHLGGMLFGVILILLWKKRGKLYSQN